MTAAFVSSRFEMFEKKWITVNNQFYKQIQTPETMRFYSQGHMAQQKILLIPEFNIPLEHYAPFFRALETKFYILAADLWGQGGSDPARANKYSIDVFVQQLQYLLDNQSWADQPFHIIGHGFGATIGAALLSNCASKALSLMLVAPSGVSFQRIQTPKKGSSSRRSSGCVCGAGPTQEIDARAWYCDKIFTDFGQELTSYYFKPFVDQWDQPQFQSRLEQFMNDFKFEQSDLYKDAITTTKEHNIPLKVLLVERDQFVDLAKTEAFFKDLGVETETLKDTKHEVFTLTPSKVTEFLKSFEKKMTLLNVTIEW